jgi:alkylation response protein AidB-like acyl-CoA dehydrogenase
MTERDDTLRMLEHAARGFVQFDAKRLRGWRDREPGFDRSLWKNMAEQGWLSMLVREEQGGLGLGIDAAATVAKQLGYACAVEPFVASGVMLPSALNRIGVDRIGGDTLAGILSGETIACVAWQNTNGSLDPLATEVTATASGSGYCLTGKSRFVAVANADAFLVSAKADGSLALFWVPAASEGLARDAEPTADGGFSAELSFNSVQLPEASYVAKGQEADAALREAVDYGTLANCAELLGNMERSLELTLEYLKTRKQFGQTIGSFQVLQHRSVDLWMKMEVARHALDAAIRRAMAPNVPARARTLAASSAKYRAAAEAHFITNECIQLHGAIGFTDEYDLGLYANRSLAIVPFLGNATEHRRRYGDLKQTAGASA